MKKVICFAIVLAIAIVMALTVPDKKEHKQYMMKAIREYVDEEATNNGIADNVVTRFGKNVVVKAIEAVLSSKLEESNYLLFNTTHIKLDDKDKLLSVGLFGQVITFDKDMLRDALEEAALGKAKAKEDKKRLKEEQKRFKEEAKAEKKRLKEEAKAEKKRLKEEAKEEKKRLKEEAKIEKKRLKEEKNAEKKRELLMKKEQREAEKNMKKQKEKANP